MLGVSLGHPDMSPPEDGGNPRHATQLLAQMPGHWAGGDTELEERKKRRSRECPAGLKRFSGCCTKNVAWLCSGLGQALRETFLVRPSATRIDG